MTSLSMVSFADLRRMSAASRQSTPVHKGRFMLREEPEVEPVQEPHTFVRSTPVFLFTELEFAPRGPRSTFPENRSPQSFIRIAMQPDIGEPRVARGANTKRVSIRAFVPKRALRAQTRVPCREEVSNDLRGRPEVSSPSTLSGCLLAFASHLEAEFVDL